MKKLSVELGSRSYPIFIDSEGSFEQQLNAYLVNEQVLIVTNTVVAPFYLDNLIENFPNIDLQILILEDGEIYKNNDSLQKIITKLLTLKFNRQSTLIALGGGVIGDLVGFAASIYQRGINFIQVPTSLLAQVDSSVGGKTAINHPLGKNMVGSFYQPKAVFISVDTLDTLPQREFVSGLAEVIKYGLIRDRGFFDWLIQHSEKILQKDKALLAEMIYRSCKHKAEVVIADEREMGERAFLNLGHTFGHALEKNMNFKGLLHGEGVSIGTMMAAFVSFKMGYLSGEDLEHIKNALLKFSLPITITEDISIDSMWEAMLLDKKNHTSMIRFVLLKSIGEATVTEKIPKEYILEAMQLGIIST